MKKIIVFLTVVIVCFYTAYSAAGEVSSKPAKRNNSLGKIQGNQIGSVQPPSEMTNEFPESVTPDKIKAFLSKPQEESYIILNFDNADLKDVINTVSTITNQNFILGSGLDARITIHSAKKIPVSEVLTVFEAVLEINGMSLVKSGRFFKIVPGSTSKQKPIPVKKSNEVGGLTDVDRPVTQIVPVKYVPVTEISSVLTPMLSQFGSIIPNPRNNLLIINDLSSNIIRLLRVLQEIDVNAFKNTRMSFFKPKYSDVLSLSNELTEVLNALNLTREGIALVPIERINSLVVFSSSPTLLKTVEGWVRKLDEEVMTGQNVFVYPVQNVKASDISEILKALYEGSTTTASKQKTSKTISKKSSKSRARTVRTKQSTQTTSSRVEIITFEPTNSLVILAPPGVYREMIKTIKKIDIYPREVLIEAVVAEVDMSDSMQLGIQWSNLQKFNIDGNDYNSLIQGSAGIPDFPSLPSAAPTLSSGDTGLSFVMFRADNLMTMVNALSTETEVKILSSPRLLVRDQEEASIEVGTDVPTATSTTSTTTTETLTQSIEYRTVGIKLKIKPTISEEKTVVLDIEQEVSSQGGDQQVGQEGNLFPIFSKTTTKTSIVVPNNQGIIIGGIMEERIEDTEQGIPLLRKIPILGYLFRWSSKEKTKKELIIIVTPRVIATKSESEKLTGDYLNKLKNVKKFLHEKEISDKPSKLMLDGAKTKKANES